MMPGHQESEGGMQKGKPAKKYSQAARLHNLVRLIEARHGVTIEEMAEETGVDRRTIHRDLNAIHDAGYPLISDWLDNRKVYRFITTFKGVPPIAFSLPELMTLYFLRSQLEVLQGTPFQDDLRSIFDKVNSVLPPRYAAHLERISRISLPLLQGRRDYHDAAGALKELREALIYQYRVNLCYRKGGQGEEECYEVDPYTMLFYKGGLYLLGYAHNRRALRTFALERISRVERGKERFEMPEEFRPEEHLKEAFGIVKEETLPVKVRFAPAIAHSIRGRSWHPTQTIVENADGSVDLSFAAGGRMEILAWVLSYGPLAEILEPQELRDEARHSIREMASRYGSSPA
jgi:proteasome accessory factor B